MRARVGKTRSKFRSVNSPWCAHCSKHKRCRSDMNAAAPVPAENQGQPVPRIDARLKVTGEARYAADMALSNLAYAVLVTTDIARGRVRSVDLSGARATRGVLDIISYGDVDDLKTPRFGNGSYTSLGPLHTRQIW